MLNYLKNTLVVSLTLFPLMGFSHDQTDWRNDKKAFESFRYLSKPELAQARSNFSDSSSEEIEIDTQFLMDRLNELSGAKPFSLNGQMETIKERRNYKNRDLTRKFLSQEYEKLGFNVSEVTYRRNAANFIAEKPGQNPHKILILSSHIDSVGNAGANDDGSGTISLLAVAKALSEYNFEYTIRVLGFDQEEIGLVGSKYYVRSLKNKEEIVGNIHLEMMATNGRKDGAFHVIDCDIKNSLFLSQSIIGAIEHYKIPLTITKACTRASDHANFWDADIPSVVISENFFGEDGDPCYHKSCDVVDSRIDFNYMAKITQAVAIATKVLLRPLNY